MKHKKLLSLLLLLLTAATGAWAAEPRVYDSGDVDVRELAEGDILKAGVSLNNVTNESDELVLEAGRYLENGSPQSYQKVFYPSQLDQIGENGLLNINDDLYTPVTEAGMAGNAWIVMQIEDKGTYKSFIIGGCDDPTVVPVTTNVAVGDSTFTEAKFAMPGEDASVQYEIVRDMSVDMVAQVGDGTNGLGFRVKEQDNQYVPVELTPLQILALISVRDSLEHKTLVLNEDYYGLIYQVNENGQPQNEGVSLDEFDFAPGLYAVKAIGQPDSFYDGESPLSNTFRLYVGYPVTVDAGGFATYYKDENLFVEQEDAELYTIDSVTDSTAVLSSKIGIAPAFTPLMVHNKGTQTLTILLIPTEDQADVVTAADQFKGVLADSTFTAEAMEGFEFYVCNGFDFVWVKDAGTIPAFRCWLQIPVESEEAGQQQPEGNVRRIVFPSETTGISEELRVKSEEFAPATIYDLQGRRVNGQSSMVNGQLKKGVYILNGKKVVK